MYRSYQHIAQLIERDVDNHYMTGSYETFDVTVRFDGDSYIQEVTCLPNEITDRTMELFAEIAEEYFGLVFEMVSGDTVRARDCAMGAEYIGVIDFNHARLSFED